MQGKSLFTVLLTAVCSLAPGLAQTTGEISGRVSDETGGALPGVTVTATSAALQGARTAVSDGGGQYRFALLPPGDYALAFELAGFETERAENVAVSLGRDTTLHQILHLLTAEQITVTSEAAVVDGTTTTVGSSFSSQAIETLPSGRNYASLVQVASGVSSDANPENQTQSTISFYGSSGAENTFYVDGVNTTGVEYGFQGKELNFEFIQAVDVKAAGYEAEFGRSTGGIVNVITKSGGNEFKGDVFGYFDNDSLQSSTEATVPSSGQVTGFTQEDYGADLGGYLVRDKLWFFVAYDKVDHTTDTRLLTGPQTGQVVESTSDRDLGAAKLTWNVAASQSLIASFFQDPREDGGAINDRRIDHSLNGEPLTYDGIQKFGGRDFALRYEGVLAAEWILTAQLSRHEEENSTLPASAAGDTVQFRDFRGVADGFQTGGFGQIVDKEFTRDAWGASLERRVSRHDLKLGLEWESEEAQVVKRMSGGQRVDIFDGAGSLPIFRHFYWTTPTASVGDAPTSRLDVRPKHDNTTVYLQDRWEVLSNLTLNVGVRWDRQEIFDRFGDRVIDLADDYAPRLGVIFDPGKDGRSKLFASYGLYYEQIPMDLVIRSFAQERQARIVNYDPTSTAPDPAAEAEFGESGILGGFFEPADPNLENQHIEELVLGYQRELAPDWSASVKGIWREYGQVIEDFLCANPETGELDGTYCIGNPGEGLMRFVFDYDSFWDDDPGANLFAAPKAKRDYQGVELELHKRYSDNWQATVSYLWSKLEGNYDGGYSPFTNVGADPNISAAYDYYDFFTDGENLGVITNDGPLSNDRRHQFKASGYFETPIGLSIGVSAYYKSGTPVTRYGFSDGYGRYEFFLSRRGAEGRTPSIYEASLHFGYPLELGPVTCNFLLDVFNVLDAQRAVLLDQRWGFQESDNSSPTPANPNYGEPVLRTPPTSVRLGVRLSF